MDSPCKVRRFVVAGASVLALLMVAAGATRANDAREPVVVADKDTEIRPGEVASLQRLVLRRGKHSWLIHLTRAWFVAPPAQRCEVYLRPNFRRGRLCRGAFLRGLGVTDEQGKVRWELAPDPNAYAQVPLPGQSFGPGDARPGALDGPFSVTGTISNRDLVRTEEPPAVPDIPLKPRKEIGADGQEEEVLAVLTNHTPVDRTLPISALEAKDANHVRISTSRGDGSGGDITVKRERGRWKITEVGHWNA